MPANTFGCIRVGEIRDTGQALLQIADAIAVLENLGFSPATSLADAEITADVVASLFSDDMAAAAVTPAPFSATSGGPESGDVVAEADFADPGRATTCALWLRELTQAVGADPEGPLDQVCVVLGWQGPATLRQAGLLMEALALACEASPAGDFPPALLGPGAARIADHAARTIRRLRSQRAALSQAVNIEAAVSPEQLRRHATALRCAGLFGWMEPDVRSAKRLYASVCREGAPTSSSRMADLLEHLATLREELAALCGSASLRQTFGERFQGIDTDVDQGLAIVGWSERVRFSLGGPGLEAFAARRVLLAEDGSVRTALRALSRDPRLGEPVEEAPDSTAEHFVHRAQALRERQARVEDLCDRLFRAGIPADLPLARLTVVAAALETASVGTVPQPPEAGPEPPSLLTDRVRAAALPEPTRQLILGLAPPELVRLAMAARRLVAATTAVRQVWTTLTGPTDRTASMPPQDGPVHGTSALAPADDLLPATDLPPPGADASAESHPGAGAAELIPTPSLEPAATEATPFSPTGAPAAAGPLAHADKAAVPGLEGGVIAEQRLLADPWDDPAARRAVGFLALARLGDRLSTIRIDPLPLDGDGHSLHWLCFASQGEIAAWRATDPDAAPVLDAVWRWLQGEVFSYGSALATAFPPAPIREAFFVLLPQRALEVLRRRAAGENLEAIATLHGVTRERIRQIERGAARRLATAIIARKATHHPAVLALFAQARRLAAEVLAAASASEGRLPDAGRDAWVRRLLPQRDAEFLLILLRVGEEVDDDIRPLFDPLAGMGRRFQDGRTAQPWRDEDVAALAAAFDRLAGDRRRRWTGLDALATAAGRSRETVAALARFAGLTVQDAWVVDGRLKHADLIRGMVAEVMAGTTRALHHAELLEALVSRGFGGDSAWHDIQRALADDPQTFVTDGNALWQLRAALGDTVEDRRPDHPDLPASPRPEILAQRLADEPDTRGHRVAPLLAGLIPHRPGFGVQAGERYAATLADLPTHERMSLVQVLHPDDETMLLDWMAVAVADESVQPSSETTRRAAEGLALLAAFIAAIRRNCGADGAFWTSILAACGAPARDWIFNSQQAPRDWVRARLVEVVATWRLRHAFAFRADPWATLIGLQAGFLPCDLDALPGWLATDRPPVAIRHLVAPGPNHAAETALIWAVLRAHRAGTLGSDAVASLVERSPWWPAWTAEEACRACTAPRPPAVAGGDPATPEPGDDADMPGPAGATSGLAPADGVAGNGPDGDGGTHPQATDPATVPTLAEAFQVRLAPDGGSFRLMLPERLRLTAGPATLVGSTFRVGATVQEDGLVRWHTPHPWAALALRGTAERLVRLERDGEPPQAVTLRLWAPDAYLAAYVLASGQGLAFDPFVSPLPRTGGVALLLHRDLQISAAADAEHTLDDTYLVAVFPAGLPVGTTVSCDGEVLWLAEVQPVSRRLLDGLTQQLALAGVSPRWGAPVDLVLSDPPAGFVPRRAVIGDQRITAAASGGTSWRFPGFLLRPGLDVLRRRGRLEGRLADEPVSVRVEVLLAQAPAGAALHGPTGWQPLDPAAAFATGRHAASRLWACLPVQDNARDWIIFEGPRPVAAYRSQGVVLDRLVHGFGEALRLEPLCFNRDDSGLPLAAHVLDTGIVRNGGQEDGRPWLDLATPLGWTERHRALAWSRRGDMTALVPADNVAGAIRLAFAAPAHPIDGICLFHGESWLGSALLAPDGVAAAGSFLSAVAGGAAGLRLAVTGRLPVLAAGVIGKARTRLRVGGGPALAALLDSAPDTDAMAHLLGRLLEGWTATPELAVELVSAFVDSLGSISLTGAPLPSLQRLADAAPCSVVRVVAHGVQPLRRHDRAGVAEALIRTLLPPAVRAATAAVPAGGIGTAAEQATLEAAVAVTDFDRNFLASRADASIASLAWACASQPRPIGHDPNLATALTYAPVRRWLTMHLLARLARELR
jgi:hypothetical protein